MARNQTGNATQSIGVGDVAMCDGKAVRVLEKSLSKLGTSEVRYLTSGKVATVETSKLYHVSEP